MRIKARICDLQKGDLFEIWGRLHKILNITETHFIYYQWDLDWTEIRSIQKRVGRKSQQFIFMEVAESEFVEAFEESTKEIGDMKDFIINDVRAWKGQERKII